MAAGNKSSYSPKEKRQASHIKSSEKAQGRSSANATKIAWATVNKNKSKHRAK